MHVTVVIPEASAGLFSPMVRLLACSAHTCDRARSRSHVLEPVRIVGGNAVVDSLSKAFSASCYLSQLGTDLKARRKRYIALMWRF